MSEVERTNKFLNRASGEVNGFAELLQRFERNISILGKSKRTFDSYSRHVAALALHFGKVPTELDPEDIKDTFLNFKSDQKPYSPQNPAETTSKGHPTPQKKQCF